ncbi:MAG: hypothetical protein RJA49_3033, partial [Actinomycetota bacterium]
TCAWVTPAGRADEYDLRATVTDAGGAGVDDVIGVMADNVAPTVAMSAPTNSSTISGLATVSATAADAATDVSDVVFQISAAGANTWSPLCTGTEVVPGTFSCQIDTTAFAFGSYDIRATATDVSGCDVVTVCPITGNTATATSTSVKIDNTVSSLNMIALPPTIAGTVSVKADAISSKPIAVTFQYQPAGSSTWTSIGCTPTITGTTYACSFNTIAVADGGITFRATMVETGGTTLTATTASTVANVTVAGYDIQATNVSTSGKIVKNDKITYTYNTLMKYTSILSGWTGASQTVYVRLRDGSAAGTGTGTDDLIDVSNSTTFPVIGTTSTSVALGAINLKNDYITTAGKSLIYKATMVATTVNSRTVVTITLGALSSGTSSTLVQSSIAKAMVWTPSSLATNSTGVACSITPVTETGTLDIDF